MNDYLLIRVLTSLIRVHGEFGERSFRDAANQALVAIARTVQSEAERKAGLHRPGPGARVIAFPLVSSRPGRTPGGDPDE